MLQRRVFERLDGDLAWLESLGASVVERDTGNPATTGTRFDTRSLTDALVRAAGDVRLGEPLRELPGDGTPVILATGGFQADRDLVREHITPEADALLLRAAPWSTGDGLRLGLAAGARAECRPVRVLWSRHARPARARNRGRVRRRSPSSTRVTRR